MRTNSTYKTARNNYILRKLSEKQISPIQFHQLERSYKKNNLIYLERDFRHNFFEYSRGTEWMEDAVGPDTSWLEVSGIISWQVRAAIETLCYEDTVGTFTYNHGIDILS
jgi:hypothetical protein